jgi:hypothetical protein
MDKLVLKVKAKFFEIVVIKDTGIGSLEASNNNYTIDR